jgi:uncharacterized protein (DUF342 family)
MDQLRARYEELSKRKTICETNLKNANDTLEDLKAQARQQYGTDDLDALERRLAEMKQENQRLQEEYRASLEAIEAGLEAVDQAYQAGS